jgi:tRNA (guanine10-N2)-methyltransferase
MSNEYLFVFAQAHDDFRLPELHSIAELHGFNITFPGGPDDCDPTRPYMIVCLEEDEHARILARRCILIR